MKKYFTKRNVLFVIIFAVLGFLALQIPFTELAGSGAKFTIYDAFAPIAGSFIGAVPGLIAVLLMELANFFMHGAVVSDAGTIIRFLPMLFAVAYFARKGKFDIIIPIIAIIAWNLNPVGRSVWYYSMFWTIPIFAYFLRDKFLLARSFGATFTAHAVGGALWIWFFNLPAAVWIALIPVTAIERTIFALGISASFVVVGNALAYLEKKHIVNLGFLAEKKYILPSLRYESNAQNTNNA